MKSLVDIESGQYLQSFKENPTQNDLQLWRLKGWGVKGFKIVDNTPIIKVEVPSTMEMGSYVTYVSGEYNQTIHKEALQDYNNARSHDGLPPIRKMPNGTKYYKEIKGKNSDGTDNFIYTRVK